MIGLSSDCYKTSQKRCHTRGFHLLINFSLPNFIEYFLKTVKEILNFLLECIFMIENFPIFFLESKQQQCQSGYQNYVQ